MGSRSLCNVAPVLSGCGWVDRGGRKEGGGREGGMGWRRMGGGEGGREGGRKGEREGKKEGERERGREKSKYL